MRFGEGPAVETERRILGNLNNSERKTDTQAVRSKPSRPALVGRRRNRLGYVAAMRERQPRGQLAGRLLWGLAVKGHHRSRHAGFPRQLGTPPIADGHHFDLVRPPADGFFEMVNDHLSGGPTMDVSSDPRRTLVASVGSAGDFTRSSLPIKRREPRRRRRQPRCGPIVWRSCQRKKCAVSLPTRFSRVIHRFSTAGPGEVLRDRGCRPACRMRMTVK